jgi:4,5-dihydroxyphthalate decarboxylase
MAGALTIAIGTYPHTKALKEGWIVSDLLSFEFAEISPINRAFAPMVRDLRFDVCEMAIATVLQAKAFGIGISLLPITVAARFQQSALLCRADSPLRDPGDLKGRRVGVRAYSQTTGLWLRGILADEYGIKPSDIRWITFEDAHVAGYVDPAFVERTAPGKDLLTLLREGEVDAVIVGNDVPNDPDLRTLFPDPAASAESFWQRHRFVPINHMIVIKSSIARDRPELASEVCRLFGLAKSASGLAIPDRDTAPIGHEAVNPAVLMALRLAQEQGLLPGPLTLEEIWAD